MTCSNACEGHFIDSGFVFSALLVDARLTTQLVPLSLNLKP
jgi:hypothetical protein